MAKGKQKEEVKLVDVEFRVSMYCNACERAIARVISKLKGVEKFVTDMNEHRVVVTGRIDPQKVLKKLRKKTGKRVEFVVKEKEEEQKETSDGENETVDEVCEVFADPLLVLGYCKPSETLMMFSDENPNACSIL